MDSDVVSKFEFSTTRWRVTRHERDSISPVDEWLLYQYQATHLFMIHTTTISIDENTSPPGSSGNSEAFASEMQ